MSKKDSMPNLDYLKRAIYRAGLPKESSDPYNGFLSYAAETHSVGYGVGLGIGAFAPAEVQALIVFSLGGKEFGRQAIQNERVAWEIRREPQYFLGGLAAGIIVGAAAFGFGEFPSADLIRLLLGAGVLG